MIGDTQFSRVDTWMSTGTCRIGFPIHCTWPLTHCSGFQDEVLSGPVTQTLVGHSSLALSQRSQEQLKSQCPVSGVTSSTKLICVGDAVVVCTSLQLNNQEYDITQSVKERLGG